MAKTTTQAPEAEATAADQPVADATPVAQTGDYRITRGQVTEHFRIERLGAEGWAPIDSTEHEKLPAAQFALTRLTQAWEPIG